MAAPLSNLGHSFGRYRVLELVGQGGMGVVFRAHDDRLNRDVAIKVLPAGALADEGARDRFRSEAQTLSKLNHPNIASVYDFDTHDGSDFIVMELVAGTPLHSRIGGRALPEDEALAYAVQIATGLEEAHERGIVHRDLKPNNIIVTPKGQVKILDFGLAKSWRVSELEPTATMTEQKIAGTMPYMAPEQIRSGAVDLRSDLWAAGVVLYEMTTGRHPFRRDQMPAMLDAILRQEPERPRVLNPELTSSCESIILQALDKDPARRFQTAGEMRRALEHLRHPSTIGSGLYADLQLEAKSEVKRVKQVVLSVLALLLVACSLLLIPSVRQKVLPVRPSLPAKKLVAVLPFKTIGSDADLAAFGEGLTETLSSKLGQFTEKHALQVIPTQEIRATSSITTDKARANFGVNLVIEGSLQKIGDTVRVNCHLVDASTRQLLEADTITGSATNAFALEDDVVTEILKLLSVNLDRHERLDLQKRGTQNSVAYDYYLRARGHMLDYHKQENISSAIAAYKRAIELDGNFAAAYAGLGEAYFRDYQLSHDNASVALSTEACQKAVALSEQSAEGHFCLGRVYTLKGEPQKAVEQFELAIVLDPNSDDAYRGLADAYASAGKLQNAEATYRRAISVRPQYWAGYSWLGQFYFKQARYDEAAQMFVKVLELSPDNFRGYSNLGAIHVLQGKYSEAINELQRSIAIRPTVNAYANLGTAYFGLRRFAEAASTYEQGLKIDDKNFTTWGNLGDARYWTPGLRARAGEAYAKAIDFATKQLQVNPRDDDAMGLLATYYAMTGNKERADATLSKALTIAPNNPDLSYRAALVHNHFGETELAVQSLARAVEEGFSAKTIRDAPDFDALRDNPKFIQLVREK